MFVAVCLIRDYFEGRVWVGGVTTWLLVSLPSFSEIKRSGEVKGGLTVDVLTAGGAGDWVFERG